MGDWVDSMRNPHNAANRTMEPAVLHFPLGFHAASGTAFPA